MHILMAWEQGLGYGHLGHLVPLARMFKDMGHEVTLAARYLENVWAAGDLPFDRVVPAPNARSVKIGQETRTFSDVIRPNGFANGRMVAALARGWFSVFDLMQPDALLTEHAFNAVFAARLRGLPLGRLGTGFTIPASLPGAPLAPLKRWEPHGEAECKAADDALLNVLNEACAMLEAAPLAEVADLFAYGEEFIQTWPELDHMGAQPGRYYYGPMAGLGGQARPGWPDRTGPKVFVYLPEDHPDRAAVVGALAQLGWPAIYHSRTTPVAQMPANITFAATPVDVAQVSASADISINHAGHGSCADAMRYGCAMLLLPNTFERSIVATQMVGAGLALLPPRQNADLNEISATLAKLHPNGCKNTQVIKQRYARYDPSAAARELAEDALTLFAP